MRKGSPFYPLQTFGENGKGGTFKESLPLEPPSNLLKKNGNRKGGTFKESSPFRSPSNLLMKGGSIKIKEHLFVLSLQNEGIISKTLRVELSVLPRVSYASALHPRAPAAAINATLTLAFINAA